MIAPHEPQVRCHCPACAEFFFIGSEADAHEPVPPRREALGFGDVLALAGMIVVLGIAVLAGAAILTWVLWQVSLWVSGVVS